MAVRSGSQQYLVKVLMQRMLVRIQPVPHNTTIIITRRERDISNAAFASAALTYWEHDLSPLPVRGKRPVPAGATGREGTVTREKIQNWMFDPEWADQNIALRADGYIGIDVDEYGDKHGAQQLRDLEAKLGQLPVTITSTARGQESESRQHFYLVPEGIEFVNKPAPDIDIIQRSHRYSVVAPSIHPDLGEPYAWYGYEGEPLDTFPKRSDFETLPEAWVEFLKVERPVYRNEQYDGPKARHASVDEERQVKAIIRDLEALPRVWEPGAGWHDIVFTRSCWLWRMVNSNAYALTEDQAANIIFTFTPTYGSEWGQDKIMEQWLSAKEQTAGQFADAPAETLPAPQEFLSIANLVPPATTKGDTFTDLLFGEPEIKTEKGFYLRRHEILLEAMRAGLTDEQAVSLAWGSTAGAILQLELQGLPKLWREAQSARAIIEREAGRGVEPAPAEDRPDIEGLNKRVDLMSDTDRERARSIQWFGSEYMKWAEESVTSLNAPYHRANRWAILSAVYSPHGVIPLKGGRTMPCNVYIMVVGDTTTGKSESVDLMKTVFKAFYTPDTNPIIGGDASPEALIEKLIMRDGLASVFISDEAHGHIKVMRQGGYLARLPEIITDLHGGNVPMILRNGKRDISGIDAKTYFIMHYAGTMRGLSEVLIPEDWESGFLNRFVWAIGEKKDRSRESMRMAIRRPGDKSSSIDPRMMQKHWAAEFEANIRAIQPIAGEPTELDIPEDVQDMQLDLAERLADMVKGHRNEHMLAPTFIRFSIAVLKMACLVAMSMGQAVITRDHFLIALEQAEEWAANIITMVDRTTESGFSKQVDDLERYIATTGGKAKLERIYSHMKLPVGETDRFVTQLVATGRVRKYQNDQRHNIVEIIRAEMEEAA